MPEKRTALILVGGEAKRSGGKEKYFFNYKGRSFLSYLIEALSPVTDEIIIVARDHDQCSRFEEIPGIRTITDRVRGIGPLGGILAGVEEAEGELLFITACDMPCIRSDVVTYLFSVIEDHDAAVPCWNEEMFEPLHAVYRKTALKEYLTTHSSLSLRAMVRGIHTRYVQIDEIKSIDPNLATFTNINDLAELEAINGSK
ncbi:MAG: molybdenum cofactor guanylyltransferase [Methanocalculus sp.]|uniref:molybdenum cofactor guanylyltransferase n=1 Tax=Methanocalculus sp. TaxID=2004547 RepID=UPI00271CB5F7|nr:molybdenum cofactor guanylyltransferase [Methanocalculus sp.]MDO9539053.1 molybdenum cofactor guanylyltransferase [Methanocalculus sp.]